MLVNQKEIVLIKLLSDSLSFNLCTKYGYLLNGLFLLSRAICNPYVFGTGYEHFYNVITIAIFVLPKSM